MAFVVCGNCVLLNVALCLCVREREREREVWCIYGRSGREKTKLSHDTHCVCMCVIHLLFLQGILASWGGGGGGFFG